MYSPHQSPVLGASSFFYILGEVRKLRAAQSWAPCHTADMGGEPIFLSTSLLLPSQQAPPLPDRFFFRFVFYQEFLCLINPPPPSSPLQPPPTSSSPIQVPPAPSSPLKPPLTPPAPSSLLQLPPGPPVPSSSPQIPQPPLPPPAPSRSLQSLLAPYSLL